MTQDEIQAMLELMAELQAENEDLKAKLAYANARLNMGVPVEQQKPAYRPVYLPDGTERPTGNAGQPLLTPEELYRIVNGR
ncbi:hypothetical protein [Microvirga sp. BSC39]|uniref:hypothetical protein n=1 Tax=Microvirga sp. BSC39 TaxID=1549810 RepID=UPI0004E8EB4C|nr:hypothetical protein [Microvirga sp. BSC39]KFG67189.1 hypothetical protein JH26_24205 [Microvirga sp. BSC39]